MNAQPERNNRMEQAKIDRINELARESKKRELTDEEKKEQKALRQEYVQAFRNSLTRELSSIRIRRPDGSLESLQKKKK